MRFHLAVLSVLFAFVFVATAMAQQTPYPTQDSDWPGKGVIRKFNWMDDNRSWFWTQRENDQGKVVFVGDSLTGNWKTLGKAFPDLKVANRGIGGDTSRGVLFRFKEDVLDLKPKAIVMLVGLNDLTAHGNPPDTLANIATMLDEAQKQEAKLPVILCTIPETHNPKAPVKEPSREAINAGIRGLASERENVELCDLEKALLGSDGKFNEANFGQDKLHLAAPGYELWAGALKPIFEQLQIKGE